MYIYPSILLIPLLNLLYSFFSFFTDQPALLYSILVSSLCYQGVIPYHLTTSRYRSLALDAIYATVEAEGVGPHWYSYYYSHSIHPKSESQLTPPLYRAPPEGYIYIHTYIHTYIHKNMVTTEDVVYLSTYLPTWQGKACGTWDRSCLLSSGQASHTHLGHHSSPSV